MFVEFLSVMLIVKVFLKVLIVKILDGFMFFLISLIIFIFVILVRWICVVMIVGIVLFLGRVSFKVLFK